jgi:hypothetical protein
MSVVFRDGFQGLSRKRTLGDLFHWKVVHPRAIVSAIENNLMAQ